MREEAKRARISSNYILEQSPLETKQQAGR
jgi:hypothetical protein